MQVSGITYRSIASQNEFSYNFNVSINSSTGNSTFAFSGDKEYLELFTFNSGKILDYNKRHVWSYNPRELIYISGNVGSGYLNYFINNSPICLFSFNSGNYFNNVVLKSPYGIADFNFDIFGKQPNYSFISPVTGVNLGEDIIFKIKNNESDKNISFQIFSGSTLYQNFYSLNSFSSGFISGLQTGNIIFRYSSNISPEVLQSGVPPVSGIFGLLILNTNFGEIRKEFNFNINSPPFYFVDFQNLFAQFTANPIQNIYDQFYQYRFDTRSSQDQNVYIKFSGISGYNNNIITGLFLGTGLLSNSSNISGFVYGNDFLTGLATGYIFSDSTDESNNILLKPFSGVIRQQQFATGNINYVYNVLITGINQVETFLKNFELESSTDDGNSLFGLEFFGKSVAFSEKNNIIVVGATGSNNNLVIGEGNIKIYTKINNQWDLIRTFTPNQQEIFFKTGVTPTLVGYLTGIGIGPLFYGFDEFGTTTINLPAGLKTIDLLVTGHYGLDLNFDGPFYAEWQESSDNNIYFNFNLADPNGVSRTSSFQYGNGLYTGYLSDTTQFIRVNYPDIGGSGAITGIINISYLDSNLQGMNFGYSVDLNNDGTIIAVGAPRYTINNNLKDIGSVWIYTGLNNNWSLSQTIIGEEKNQYLGQSVSLKNDVLAIGTQKEDNVWIYEKSKDKFSEISRLINPRTGFKGFSHSLNLSNDGRSLVVGAPTDNIALPNLYNSGSVWVYDNKNYFKTWTLKQRLNSNIINNSKLFFPILGNHDYDANPGNPRVGTSFISYFTILNKLVNSTSKNPKYYDFRIGDIHFFILDSEPVSGGSSNDGNIQNGAGIGDDKPSTTSNGEYVQNQKEWFNKTISLSNARYKFVFFHHPSFNTGGIYRGFPNLSPYKGWKIHLADGVFNGHEHLYQRLTLLYQNPSYINVTNLSNTTLKITYKSPGILFGTTQLRINIGYNDFQETSLENMSFDNSTNEWFFIYNIPSNADYVNFYFQSANNNLDRNTLNNREYDYIYYLNDSNDFTKTTYNIVGNGGVDLRTGVRADAGFLNWHGVIDTNFYGFTRVDIFASGIKYNHFGIRNGGTTLGIEDIRNVGNTTTPVLLSFAATADWGNPNGGVLTQPSSLNFKTPGNNFYVEKIASTIRSQNINYVFGVGDLNYTFTDSLSRANSNNPVYIDENVGQFYFDYIPCYRGVYSGYRQINSSQLSTPIIPLTGNCTLANFGINNATWGNTTIDSFGNSVYINQTGSLIAVGGPGNVGYLNNGSVWLFTGNIVEQSTYNNLQWGLRTRFTGTSNNDKHGTSVDISDDSKILIAGIQNGEIGQPDTNAGLGIIYTSSANSDWRFKQHITGDFLGGEYGYSAVINGDGNVILLGSIKNYQSFGGGVLIYTGDYMNNWRLKQKLNGINIGDQFGSSLAINKDGTILVIGANGFNGDGGINAGAAFVYTGNSTLGWTFQQELTGLSTSSFFGTSVAINDNSDIILVGGDRNTLNGNDAGATLVYTGNSNLGWRLRQVLFAEAADNRFGHSVTINSTGNLIFIGAPFNTNSAGTNAGALYIYSGNSNLGWQQYDKLIGNQANDRFGTSVKVNKNNNVIVVGADPNKISPFLPLQTGKAMIFTGNANTKWRLKQTLTGSVSGDQFGSTVTVNRDGDIVVVGSPNYTINNLNVGSIQIYTGTESGSIAKWDIYQNINSPNINSSGTYFGFSIDGSNNGKLLIIGAPAVPSILGLAYIYTGFNNNRYNLKQSLTQESRFGVTSLNFGHSVASNYDGSNIVIGTDNSEGVIYIFKSDIYTSLVSNQTGLLTGLIEGDQGSFTWTNISITGTGMPGFVFIDNVTGYLQSTGILTFLNNTGSGLSFGDTISINNVNFTYTENPLSNFEFNSLDNFINNLNSGATGSNIILNSIVGVTGFKNNNQIILYSYAKTGIAGNSITISRNTQNLEAVKIPSRYFRGGQDLRPIVNNWSGSFSGFFNNIIAENSGIYIINSGIQQLFSGDLTGIKWVDSFNKWSVQTGLTIQAQSPPDSIFNNLIYNNNLNIYSGSLKIDKAAHRLVPFASLFLNFRKQVYTNTGQIIFNNSAKYEISGDNFIYTGILTG